MMALFEHYSWLKSLWTAWFFLMFVGVVAWTLWPSRRARWAKLGDIPLQDSPRNGGNHD
ncbi:cbb3-type cytochrome oxidase subunit 3 [Ferrovibrio sp.]|uniref:cbb3-type cytochrome oxidase subunit 3 n=1 Tax=Ferrovibrio sp. TaxID=1917215 RepID=UPI003D13BEA1